MIRKLPPCDSVIHHARRDDQQQHNKSNGYCLVWRNNDKENHHKDARPRGAPKHKKTLASNKINESQRSADFHN